ncbi:hypothetical protein PR202_ga03464 [Eleusine coracana subsp. coracana]|uniref:Uncharacterized protein n=1 Tax=Eleusine coracana subsp. coracana TaxID=191504 RepID=A0AAV5BQG1_ELECO|nr:hypothetical protein PR202_ga03464 [Eleusine coracana subsp. coracana]
MTSEMAMNNNKTTMMEVEEEVELLLGAARPFLRGELEKVDPSLPGLVSVRAPASVTTSTAHSLPISWTCIASFGSSTTMTYLLFVFWFAP